MKRVYPELWVFGGWFFCWHRWRLFGWFLLPVSYKKSPSQQSAIVVDPFWCSRGPSYGHVARTRDLLAHIPGQWGRSAKVESNHGGLPNGDVDAPCEEKTTIPARETVATHRKTKHGTWMYNLGRGKQSLHQQVLSSMLLFVGVLSTGNRKMHLKRHCIPILWRIVCVFKVLTGKKLMKFSFAFP